MIYTNQWFVSSHWSLWNTIENSQRHLTHLYSKSQLLGMTIHNYSQIYLNRLWMIIKPPFEFIMHSYPIVWELNTKFTFSIPFYTLKFHYTDAWLFLILNLKNWSKSTSADSDRTEIVTPCLSIGLKLQRPK